MTRPNEALDALSGTVRTALHAFLDVHEPLRADLYRYCRHLTRSAWDAEDLAQETLARAFASLGMLGAAPPNPRAWLFRVASNLWIDRQRRPEDPLGDVPRDRPPPDPRAVREAMATLVGTLSPQERAAVVLKDVLDLSLDETAEVLSTTAGAVKAALHRGRGKLIRVPTEPEAAAPRPTPRALDAFCAAFQARDVDRLLALLLESSTVEVVGASLSEGSMANRKQMLSGMLFGTARLAEAATRGGIEARFVTGALAESPRAEVRWHGGEPIVVLFYAHRDGDFVRAINRFELDERGERIARLQNYFFTPGLLQEVARDLGLPWRSNGHRFWLTGCEDVGPEWSEKR